MTQVVSFECYRWYHLSDIISLVWGHSLCEDFYHANKDFDKFNKELSDKCNVGFKAYRVFDQSALMERSRLLYEIVKVIWEVS